MPSPRHLPGAALIVLSLALSFADRAAAASLSVDPQNRAASVALYHSAYVGSANVPMGWSAGSGSCSPGTTSAAHREAMETRINYFRAMAGVRGNITLNSTYNTRAQAAAHLMSVNDQLSHTPPTSWRCWSQNAYDGAASSNLYLQTAGVDAIDGYMRDPGSFNAPQKHRRWILHPPTRQMGVGDVPPTPGRRSANALVVFDGRTFHAHPASRNGYVAWPPPGYVPHDVAYPRWHFSIANADFSNARVAIRSGGRTVAASIEDTGAEYGLSYINWRVGGLSDYDSFPIPIDDTTYEVTISNVRQGSATRSFRYDVTLINPELPPGDFNADGVVNAADYTVWRDSGGSSSDYRLWRDNYGDGGASATARLSSPATTPVPEPGTLASAIVAAVGLLANRRR